MYTAQNIQVNHLTTVRIGGVADRVYFPDTPEELVSLTFELNEQGIPWSVLGAGSNTLISSEGVRGALVCTTSLNYVSKTSPETLTVGGGVRLPKLAAQTAQMGLSGCEFLEGIPGSIGGAVVMNAGAHSSCMSNILEKVIVLDRKDCEVKVFTSGELKFDYRSSNIDPRRYTVLEAKLRLSSGTRDQIQNKMKEYRNKRASSQPKGFSSGCTFRNPPQGHAGRLIDELGFKGQRMGGAEISNIHANFILNSKASATSQEICSLIRVVQLRAWRHRSTWLKPEVHSIGEFRDEEKVIWLSPQDWQEAEEDLHLKVVNG